MTKDSVFFIWWHQIHIVENRNLHICVSDNKARAVVVVAQIGKLQFTYPGSFQTTSKRSIKPYGITTDNQSWILISDCSFFYYRIQILDQDEQFPRFIDNYLNSPIGLCIDTIDNPFASDQGWSGVKIIRYNTYT